MSALIILTVVVVIIIVLYMVSPFVSPKAMKLDGGHVLVSHLNFKTAGFKIYFGKFVRVYTKQSKNPCKRLPSPNIQVRSTQLLNLLS